MLAVHRHLEEPVLVELRSSEVAIFTQAMPGKASNEDRLGIAELDDGSVVLSVADGVGSTMRAGEAAEIAVETVAGLVSGHGYSIEAVMQAFDAAHEKILALACGAATTLVVAAINAQGVRAFNTGDSGMLVSGQRGALKLKTTFHSPTGYAEEAGLVGYGETLEHVDRHYVSNVLGARPMSVEVSQPQALARFDTVVLASDGVWDNLTQAEVIDAVRRGPLRDAAQALRTQVLKRMRSDAVGTKPDDLTFVAYRQRP